MALPESVLVTRRRTCACLAAFTNEPRFRLLAPKREPLFKRTRLSTEARRNQEAGTVEECDRPSQQYDAEDRPPKDRQCHISQLLAAKLINEYERDTQREHEQAHWETAAEPAPQSHPEGPRCWCNQVKTYLVSPDPRSLSARKQ